jgi:electron transport complex protein RnfG
MSKIKHFLQQSWLLIASAFFFGLLIAVANASWRPRIEQNKIDKLNRLMGGLLSQADRFVPAADVEITTPKGKKLKSSVYKALAGANGCVGWGFVATGAGFADKIELVIAVDKDSENFAGFAVLASNETPGFGDQIKNDYYRNQFVGAPVMALRLSKTGDDKVIDSEIIVISGATVSSEAVVKIINGFAAAIKSHLQEKGLISNGK